MDDLPFDAASPGAQRLARTAARIQADRTPVDVVMKAEVLALGERRTLRSGERVTVDRGLAEALVERGAARLAS